MKNILYISYDGMLEPLGQSQVLSYLEALSVNYNVYLISFEKQGDWAKLKNDKSLKMKSVPRPIKWFPLRYHKSPSVIATAYDVFRGVLIASLICIRNDVNIVHARSYVSSVVAIIIKRLFKSKYIFDMRGFWVDEKVDAGVWRRDSFIYRLAKDFEKKFLLSSDCIVTLSNKSVNELRKISYLDANKINIKVIPTCTNTDLFFPDPNACPGPGKPFTLGYVGSVGTFYQFDKVIEFFKIFLKIEPDSLLYILNRNDHDLILESISRSRLPSENVKLESSEYRDVAMHMRRMNAGILFFKQSYSKIASSPTKMGEFLSCGIPCVSDTNAGDVEDIINDNNVGVCVRNYTESELIKAANKIIALSKDAEIKQRCRDTALRSFSLEDGIRQYDLIYRQL